MNASSHWGGAEDYERLRSHVLGGPVPEGWLLRTLDVLSHSGLAVWMIFGWPEVKISHVASDLFFGCATRAGLSSGEHD
jgi:hypothetical protein